MRAFLAALLAAAGLSIAEDLTFHPVPRELVESRLQSLRFKNSERQTQVAQLFREAGCLDIVEHSLPKKRPANVICTLPGRMDRQIVVGAHFDKVSMGDGAVDNWTGAALLSSLYQAIHPLERHHTFVFVSFAEEEQGLLGSKEFVRNWDLSRVAGMVNIDSLGLSGTKVWVSRSDPRFVSWAASVAQALKVPLEGVNVDQVGQTDSFPFQEKKISSIDFHSLTQQTLKTLHSPFDQLKAVNRDYYYDSYTLIAAYLAFLDRNLAALN